MNSDNLLRILPLASAVLWIGIGIWPFLRQRYYSAFERSLSAFAILLGAWAGLDWVFLGLTDPAWSVPLFGLNFTVLALTNLRISLVTVATIALLHAAKWLAYGHSRYDGLLFVPVLGSFALIWGGMTSGAVSVSWGLRLVRDPTMYLLWAVQQSVYVGLAATFTAILSRRRSDLPVAMRRRIIWSIGSLFLLLGIWMATNMYNNITQTAGVPWFSSSLLVPGVIILVTLVPMKPQELGVAFRALSGIQEKVVAIYLFYRSGEPLVALASGRSLPIEAEQLEGLLYVVGHFVETSTSSFKGYATTAMVYDNLGIVAVRGRQIIAAAVYEAPAYDALLSELRRTVQGFETRRAAELRSLDSAARVAEEAADELSALLYRPERTKVTEAGKPLAVATRQEPPAPKPR